MEASTRFIPYVRRSRSDEDVVSIEDQRKDIEAWAQRAGVTLLPFVEEPMGTSGDVSWADRKVGEIVRRLKAGEAEGIAVAYFSRLTRERHSETFALLEELQPFRRADARAGRVTEPGDELGWQDVIEAHQARQERQTLKKHLTSGKHSCWERGAVVSGRVAPAGYAFEREPFANRMRPGPLFKTPAAEDVGDAVRARAGGASWSEVCRLLDKAGVPHPKDGRWRTQSAAQLFRSPILKGVLRCSCGCGSERVIPELAVCTPSEWAAAQTIAGAHGRVGRPAGTGRALLAGTARCGTCGRTLMRSNNGQGLVVYRCQNNACDGRATAVLADLDRLALEEALAAWLETNPAEEESATVEELAALEHERDRWTEELAGLDVADMGARAYGAAVAACEEKLEAAEAALAEAAGRQRTPVDKDEAREVLSAWLEDPDPREDFHDHARRLLRERLESVTVSRAPRGTELRDRVRFARR